MKLKAILSLILLFSLPLCIFAAGPVIDFRAPVEGEKIPIGDAHGVHLVVRLSDEDELSRYKVEIIPEDEERKKKKPIFSKSWNIKGNSVNIHHHEIIIPGKIAPGRYIFRILCRNSAGKTNQTEVSVELIHP